jgi:hypothetical protein
LISSSCIHIQFVTIAQTFPRGCPTSRADYHAETAVRFFAFFLAFFAFVFLGKTKFTGVVFAPEVNNLYLINKAALNAY